MISSPQFEKEADLCAAFMADVAEQGKWTAYPETAGFDILLVRKADGAQIGIEAKLALNVKAITQILPSASGWSADFPAPDYRAILVPEGKVTAGLGNICAALGVTVLQYRKAIHRYDRIRPVLPALDDGLYRTNEWHEWAPAERCKLPDYIPDVVAGASAPVALTNWKVAAIKLVILLEERPVTRKDFKYLNLSPTRWTDPYTGWLVKGDGGYVTGPKLPDFKAQHPTNYEQIKADKAKWMPPADLVQARAAS